MPAISIVLTVRDASGQLSAGLEALATQTFTDFEVLCICSGACSYMPAELQKLASEDGRFKLFAADMSGLSFTWRDALSRSDARFAYLMDDHTVLEPRMLEVSYGLADRLDLDVALCNGVQVDDSGATAGSTSSAQVIRRDLLPLHEAFSASEIDRQLFDAVPQWSWNRIYRREYLLDCAVPDKLATPATNRALALTALAAAGRIDFVSSALATHGGTLRVHADDVLGELLKAKRHLENRGLYQQCERDFVNYAAAILLDLLGNLPSDEQVSLCARLPKACDELGISGRERKYFYQGQTYDELAERLSWANPSVSVLMPSLNVAPFIRLAVESVLNQTLKSIEVLCIDAGSTDGTLEILREYEEVDPRIRVIESDKRSYGYQMNLGLAAARGEFIGIVETDDFADPEMFETLYRKAKRHNAQVVKGNYYDYQTKPVEKSIFHRSYYRLPYDCLLTDEEKIEIIRRIPCIWSGIYETKMLRDNGIDFLETPGASYQDTSFVLKVWVTVERAVLDEHGFLHYRNDNVASSVRQSDKVYFVNGEFASAYEYCHERHGSKSGFTKSLRCRQAVAYLWNYNRIADEFRPEYLERIRDEFVVAREAGELDRKYFWPKEWDAVHRIMDSPSDYYASQQPVRRISRGIEDGPVLSLIVNACGCDERIACCLESIARQDLSFAEVILVDDQRDATVSAQLEACVAKSEGVELVRDEEASAGRLLDEAVARARGESMLFLDGNSALEIDAVRNLVDYLQKSSADVVLLQHDEFDVVKGELVARGKGAELGQRRNLAALNAQTDARTILQIADAHVANKVFRRSLIEQEQLGFSDDAHNWDVAFCELGLLHAASVEVNPATLVDVLVGKDDARDVVLKLRPEAAVDAWQELFEEAGRQGLLDSHAETLANAAAAQLADDLETLRGCYDERAQLCAAIAGNEMLASRVACQGRPFYESDWVYDRVHGATQAVAFAGGEEVEPHLRQAAAVVKAVRDAVFGMHESGEGAAVGGESSLAELVACAVGAAREAGGVAGYLWWCLPAREQQVLDQLVGTRLHDQKVLSDAEEREASMQAGLDEAQHKLLLSQRELAETKRQLASASKQLATTKKLLETAKKQHETTKKQLAEAKDRAKEQKKRAKEDVKQAKEAVKASRSYRLGSAIGAPLRAVRSARDKLAGE